MGKIVRIGILAVVVGFIIFIIVFLLTQRQVISPVPEEGAIRIIYLSPSPTVLTTPSVLPKPTN